MQVVLSQTPKELQHRVEIMAFNLSGALKLNYLCLRGSVSGLNLILFQTLTADYRDLCLPMN